MRPQRSAARAGGGESPSAPPAERSDSYRQLAEVFHDVLSEQSLDTLLDRIADTLVDLIPYDTLTIYRADDAARVLVPVLARDRWASEILQTTIAYGSGLTGWATERREAVLVCDVQHDPRAQLIPGTPEDEPEALICVPLVARGQLKGALNVYRLGDAASFTAAELELAERFGDAAALALDNAETRARLEHQAQTDSLTGLFNHRVFHERLRAELARTSRGSGPVAVLMIDVDDFKRVNDIFGHATGDQALVQVAELVSTTVRESDVVCRLGGEEFGVVMPDADAESARALAHRLRDRLAITVFDPVGHISVSTGIAQAPTHAMNPRELSACAEAAMMTAKASGGARVVVFGEEAGERPSAVAGDGRDARSIAHLKMLQSLVGKLNRLNDVDEIGMTIVGELRTLVDYHSGRVYLADGDDLVPIAFLGDVESYGDGSADALACRVGEGITGHAAASGQALLVPNALECELAVQIPGTPLIEESIVAVPLRYAERSIGVIVVSKLGVDQFDDADVRLIEVLAGHASVALENARLYAATRREAEHARESAEIASALLQLSRVLAASPSLDEVLRRVVEGTAKILGTDRASIWIEDDPRGPLRLGAEHGHRPEEVRALATARLDPELVGGLTELDRPAVVDGRALHAAGAPLTGTDAPLAVALLRLEAGRIGLIAAPWPGSSEPARTDRRMRLLAGIADQAMLAIGNARSFESLEQTFLSTVEALANALEANSERTSAHARSLTDTVLLVGRELGMDEQALKRLELGALFHDIGKIGVPSEILTKPGPLTPAERAAIEHHPSLGERILAPIERLAEVRPIVRHCHERWDGAGYPDGLAGEAIPLESRVIFVCDSFHAMTTDRPYRRRLTQGEARRRLLAASGSQFDPRVVDAFVELLDTPAAGREDVVAVS
jgi:diguanylate cyclase (GGDEF)-like protein